MEVVGAELVAFGMHFDNCDSIRNPFPDLLVSMGIDVELVQEGLEVALVLDGQKVSLEILSEGKLIFAISLVWWISGSSTD